MTNEKKQPHVRLPRAEWLATLPRAYIGCVCLATSEGKVLLVHDPYGDFWSLPGGGMEAHESPEECARREFEEETGIDTHGRLLLAGMVWGRPSVQADPWPLMNFLYDTGEWPVGTGIQLPEGELDRYGWFGWNEALKMMPGLGVERLRVFAQWRTGGQRTLAVMMRPELEEK